MKFEFFISSCFFLLFSISPLPHSSVNVSKMFSILEVEEENYSEKSETSSKISNLLTVRHTENTLQFKYDLTTINRIDDERHDNEITYKLNLEQRDTDDSLLAFCPIEVYERNFLRNLQQQKQKQQQQQQGEASCSSSTSAFDKIPSSYDDTTTVSNSLQIPIISLPLMERPPVVENVYMSDNMTIIDTDLPVSTFYPTIQFKEKTYIPLFINI